jgi:transcriptional regulator with XRE-family HTH domain
MNYSYVIYYVRVHLLAMSQAEFCDAMKLNRCYLSTIENGKQRPGLSLLERLAQYCNIPLPALLCIGQPKDEIQKFLNELL